MIKKILFIALKYSYGKKELGESLNKKAHSDQFKALGYQVENLWIDEYKSNKELQKVIFLKADEFNPDLIFFKIFKFEIQFNTLKRLRKKYFLVNWFGDDQWRFDTFSSKYANYFNVCITTDKFSINKYHDVGQKNIIRSQHASFENYNNYKDIIYKYDISFIGGFSPFRKWFIDNLLKKGIKVECFGSGWENGRVTYVQMNHIMLHSKINLNISNSLSYDIRYLFHSPKSLLLFFKNFIKDGLKNTSQTKARIFEIPIRGGFELTEYVPSLEDYYCIGKNIICYNSVDEAKLLIEYYLKNEKEREELKNSSVEYSRLHHTYNNRMKILMKDIILFYEESMNEYQKN